MADREAKPQLTLPTHKEFRIGIARAAFNNDITAAQLAETERCLQEYNIAYDVVTVSGCYELVYALDSLARTKRYDGLVAVGCLIKGETIHFDVIAEAVTHSILDLTTAHQLPIGFGIITALTTHQAEARTWFGYDAAYATIDALINVQRAI